tara:strand:- start:70 stop:294 length:225 start_codon:yes stop_codon:yes gene_type:complete
MCKKETIGVVMKSPCVRQCTLNENDMCLGCGRMLGEITSWVSFSEQKRADVMTQCQNRLQALKTWKPGLVDQKK